MKNKQIATFGGGCFWCVEAVVQRLEGVESVVSGYAGGETLHPTYRDICTTSTTAGLNRKAARIYIKRSGDALWDRYVGRL